ncbi:probable alkylated DNA repair protein alkB homolog 8 [Coccomyxa sp. Obi]|nr:probable alkylated DNA repair protein alkB homolog 8 [Coccomyxa sp. Obi]
MFIKPKHTQPTQYLFVGNCGTAVGLNEETVKTFFDHLGAEDVIFPTEGKPYSHIFVVFNDKEDAEVALTRLNGQPCQELGNRILAAKYADVKEEKEVEELPVYLSAQECAIPGLELHHDFVSEEEEQELLAEVEDGCWETLARRRVQHFGYRFEYWARNVDINKPIRPLPPTAQRLLQRLEQLLGVHFDQLTVNEYNPGVGLSSHIDTHSAFTGPIVSLSLAGPCVMELRRGGVHRPLHLPPRSLLVLAGEARLAWHHYIPHRRADTIAGRRLPRASRRVSFTFRKVRGFPCDCSWPECCDSQGGGMPPTRMALAFQAGTPQPTTAAAMMPFHTGLVGSELQGSQQPSAEQHGIEACSSGSEALVERCDSDAKDTSSSCACDQLRMQSPGEPMHSPADASDSQPEAEQRWSTAGPSCVPRAPEASLSALELRGSSADQSDEHLERMEARYVHNVYDIIATHFSATRFAIWPKVKAFLQSLPPGALLADVGCGNGKYFGVRPDIAVLGSDRSPNLAETAARRLRPTAAAAVPGPLARCDVAVADGLHLPYRSGALDAVVCIAVLHHIASGARRVRLLVELARVLRPGGRVLITVWASQQEEPGKLAKWEPIPSSSGDQEGVQRGDYFVPWHIPLHRVEAAAAAARTVAASHANSADRLGVPRGTPNGAVQHSHPESVNSVGEHCSVSDAGADVTAKSASQSGAAGVLSTAAGAFADGRVDRAKGTVVFKRYYHLFDEHELDSLVLQVPGVRITDSFYDKSNWCVVYQKVSENL